MKLQIRIFLFLLILIWVIGLFAEFFIPLQNGIVYIFPFLEGLYSTVCHQQPEKLIELNGYHTLVCARCTGIYIGGLFSSLIFLVVSKLKIKNRKLMLIASVPMLTDVILYSSGLYHYNKSIAFATGLLFGSIGIAYIYHGLQILLEKK